jgi:hypothetical protein
VDASTPLAGRGETQRIYVKGGVLQLVFKGRCTRADFTECPTSTSAVAGLHGLIGRGRFAIHERDRNTFGNHEQCLESHQGGLVSTKAYRLRRCWNDFIRHLAGAQLATYRISDIPLDLKALTEALAV